MRAQVRHKSNRSWRDRLFEIIFEADTPAGKWFDIALIVVILLSVLVVMLDSATGEHAATAAQYASLSQLQR